jgi:cytosine/adenosine deaminase-related metal-dependent hydrolase
MNSAATSPKTLLTAAWVAPMDQPIIRDGALVFADGTILAVGDAKTLRAAHPDAQLHELGAAVILPGLVNPHTHLELSHCNPGDPPVSFGDWIIKLGERSGRNSGMPHEELFGNATRLGIEQCLRFGITTVGDISQQMQITRPILRAGPIRSISYGEVLGLAKLRPRYDELLPCTTDRSHASGHLRIGLTPHAPYTVDLPGYRQCIDLARTHNLPLATHLAETPHERDFLEHHGGELRELWDSMGLWADGVETFRAGPIDFASEIGLLDYPTLLAHVNYCDDRELAVLSRGRASVVYCPRTHRFFGHPPHRWRDMLARGINIAVGTDSCASSPDLNLVDELRLLHEIALDFPVDQLWQMATTRAARAVAMDDAVGSITSDKAADFVAFNVRTDAPLVEVLEEKRLPLQVWIRGQPVERAAEP